MKTDEIIALAREIRLERILIDPSEIFIRPEDVTFDIKGKGDLLNTFPIPECSECELKCCPPYLGLSLFDIARFMDAGIDDSIAGTFEGYIDFSQWQSGDGLLADRPVPYIDEVPPVLHCRFLRDNEKCGIYGTRTPVCRSFPLTLQQDNDGNLLIQWIERCKHYKISQEKAIFLQLFDDLIRSYNEWTSNHMLIIHARDQLRDMGFGKYLGNEQNYQQRPILVSQA